MLTAALGIAPRQDKTNFALVNYNVSEVFRLKSNALENLISIFWLPFMEIHYCDVTPSLLQQRLKFNELFIQFLRLISLPEPWRCEPFFSNDNFPLIRHFQSTPHIHCKYCGMCRYIVCVLANATKIISFSRQQISLQLC